MLSLSVVTVAYNSAATIGAALESVNAQDWPALEQVVIDGGSSDATTEIVRAVGRRVATLISEPDRGIYDAMNKGVRAATGDVIAFLNSDDRYAEPGSVRRALERMETEGLDAAFGDVAFFRSDAPDRIIRRYRSDRFRPERLAWGWMPAHTGLFVRREWFAKVGPFATDYRIAGDFEWIVRAFRNGGLRTAHIPEILVLMQAGGASTGGWRSTLRLNREVMRACKSNGLYTNWFMLLSKYPWKLLELLGR